MVPHHHVKFTIDQVRVQNRISSGGHDGHLVFQNGANFESSLAKETCLMLGSVNQNVERQRDGGHLVFLNGTNFESNLGVTLPLC